MKSVSKSGLAFSLALIFGCAAALAAHESPARRTCRTQGGISWDVKTDDDQITLCRFGGLGVDADTFYQKVAGFGSKQAVVAFLSQNETDSLDPESACESAGGAFSSVTDLEGAAVLLCTFPDQSKIEAVALSAGPNSGAGAALADALRR
jgi:putative hemolysin